MVASLPAEAPPLQAALAAAEWLPALQAQGAEPLHRILIGVLQSTGESTGLVPPQQAQLDVVPMAVDPLPINSIVITEESGPSPLLAGPVLLLVEGALGATTSTSPDGSTINSRHLEILSTGFSLTQDPQALLQHIIEATLRLAVNTGKRRTDWALCFAASGLGDLLQHWRNGYLTGRYVRDYPVSQGPYLRKG